MIQTVAHSFHGRAQPDVDSDIGKDPLCKELVCEECEDGAKLAPEDICADIKERKHGEWLDNHGEGRCIHLGLVSADHEDSDDCYRKVEDYIVQITS